MNATEQRTLLDAPRVSPARSTDRREPGGGEVEAAYYSDVVRIPGFRAKPDRCRDYRPVGFCEHNGHTVLGQSSCGLRDCPDHYGDWIERGVESEVARLAAYRHVQEGASKRMVHVVVSPPQDRRWSADAVFETRTGAYDVAGEVGVRGGSVHVHPYRTSADGDHLFETAVEHGDLDEDTGKWRVLRESAEDWEGMKRYIEPAPHYHILAAVEDLDGEAVPEGWVVKNVRSMGRFDYRDVEAYRDMVRTSWYVRTHEAALKGRQSVTYFGEVHPAAFDPEEELPPDVWATIQANVEKAMTTRPGGTPLNDGETCPVDGCESPVLDLMYLNDYLKDGEWLETIAPKQRVRLYGIKLWVIDDRDRPPPDRRRAEEGLLMWLEAKGGEAYRAGTFTHELGVGSRPERSASSTVPTGLPR